MGETFTTMNLQDKTILVTGAGGIGVGAGVCQAVHLANGRLVVNDLTPELAHHAAEPYPNALPFAGDISSASDVDALFDTLEARGIWLDGLVNNAGIGLSRVAQDASEDEFDRLHQIDLRGVWLMSRAFTRHVLKAGKGGSIVNVSSVHAAVTMSRYAIYAGAKAGVEGLTRGLAVELGAHNIRCNAIAPGYVHSEQGLDLIRTWADDPTAWVREHTVNHQALEHQIEPIDCGWAAVFFLCDLSRAITGQILRIDAGMTVMLYNKDFL